MKRSAMVWLVLAGLVAVLAEGAVAAPSASGAPHVKPGATADGVLDTSGQVMTWVYTPLGAAVPGVLVDPEPDVLQDFSLNSSFVARLTIDGRPVANAQVAWQVSDPEANIQAPFSTTDDSGLARAWLIGGTAAKQEVTVVAVGSTARASFVVERALQTPATVGRYVTLYLDAPKLAKDVTQVLVGVTPHTAPNRTYYQLTSAWSKNGPLSFYGGLQKLPCPDTSGFAIPSACAPSRGVYTGSVALFSMWDGVGQDNVTVRPRPINVPASTVCQEFGHEGNGLQCMASLDWRPEQRVDWKVKKTKTATGLGAVVQVSASVDGGLRWQQIGTFVVPSDPNLANIAAFNENWGGQPAPTCQQVEVRSMTINRTKFQAGRKWYTASDALASGGLYPGALACQNYEVVSIPGRGIRITSGGIQAWESMKTSAEYGGAGLPLGQGFPDLTWARNLYQRPKTSSLS